MTNLTNELSLDELAGVVGGDAAASASWSCMGINFTVIEEANGTVAGTTVYKGNVNTVVKSPG